MHPFLPISAIVLNLMGVGFAYFLVLVVRPDPILNTHQPAVVGPMACSFLFGIALTIWLWRKGIRYPTYGLGVAALALFVLKLIAR